MQRLQKGFGLVEIMIGLVVGMISMLVVLQVFQNAEARKRTITAGADAQSSGAIALYMLEHDTRMAGWGLTPGTFAGCQHMYAYCDGSAACGGKAGPLDGMSFNPLQLTDGGKGPDTITVKYFADPVLGSFRLPSSTTLRKTMPQSSSELDVNSVSGCKQGDMMLLRQAGNCTLANITQIQAKDESNPQGPKIQHNPGAGGTYNPPESYQNTEGWPAYTRGANLTCFRPGAAAPVYSKEYSLDVANRRLERSDNNGTKELVMADIVDMQAQYGIADPSQQDVAQWVDADTPPWNAPGVADWPRIKAVRIALVARGTQYERPAKGAACTTTTLDTVATWPKWAKFDPTNYPDQWGCYRYKVFETVIPLRNVIWGNL